ncbi:MAG: hypothetical protein KKA07_01265, partial [Bacteroidetes bacterium]|nr:hypothetical protein [Bacteroidota bacterium]
MRKQVILLAGLLFAALMAVAQAPQTFKYQAAARNTQGDIMANKLVSFRISILSDSPIGNAVYVETHNTATNEYGLVTLVIGSGTPVSGSMTTIDWGSAEYFLKTEIDLTGGSSYDFVGTSQLLSVPYAFYAETAANAADDFDKDASNELQTISKTGNTVTLSQGGGTFTDADTDAQTLTLNGNTIGITNGNSIVLPPDNDGDTTNELQTITRTGTDITLSKSGGTISIADNDNNATNELQTISKTGSTVTLSQSGGSFTDEVDDADNNPTNEIQVLSFSNDTLYLSNGSQVFLGAYTDNTDNQTISIVGNELIISNGNSVVLSGTIDLDADPVNELQDLTISGDSVLITGGTGIRLPHDEDADSLNEIQLLTFSNDTMYLTKGNYVVLSIDQLVPSGTCIYTMSETPPAGFQYSGISQSNPGNWEYCPKLSYASSFSQYSTTDSIFCGLGYPELFVYCFNMKAQANTRIDIPPTQMDYSSNLAVYNEKIYVTGGSNTTGNDHLWVYDLLLSSWAQKTNLPYLKGFGGSCSGFGKIYCFGGFPTSSYRKASCYDIINNSWSLLPDLPCDYTNGKVVFYDSAAYVFFSQSSEIKILRYSIVDSLWEEYDVVQKICETNLADASHALIDNKVYFVENDNSIGFDAMVMWSYDIDSKTTQIETAPDYLRYHSG